jgi:hypothetical protein
MMLALYWVIEELRDMLSTLRDEFAETLVRWAFYERAGFRR